jgi:hypothetical protein
MYRSMAELSQKADLIIIATLGDTVDTINMARLPGKPDEIDPHHFGIGLVYPVRVEQWLKGKSPENIYLLKSAGLISAAPASVTAADIEATVKASQELLPTPGKRYLLFLQKSLHTYEKYPPANIFVIGGHPWLFDASHDGCVRLEDQFTDLSVYFPPRSLPETRKMIADPVYARQEETANPYPSAEVLTDCNALLSP